MSYQLRLTQMALRSYTAIPDSQIGRVDETLDAIGGAPWIGRLYDPAYEAARPPFEVRVAYAGNYGIYYTADEDTQTVIVRFIEDQRMDPTPRFTGRLGR